MRIIKAKVYIDRSTGNTTYRYRQEWLDNKTNFPTVLYPKDRTDDGLDNNGIFQYVYPMMDDATATLLLSKYPLEFSVTTLSEVTAYSAKHVPQTTIINDQIKVLMLISKTVLGTALTQLEKDALDPTKSTDGVITTPPWTDLITQYGAKF